MGTAANRWRWLAGTVLVMSLRRSPNAAPSLRQVMHRDRVLFNVRNGWDVAKFLSDPQKEDVAAHRANLERLAEERGHKLGWVWHMLCTRWGADTLRGLGLRKRDFAR